MSAPSALDITAGLDPTGYTSITGAQLLQIMSAASPYSDKGFIVLTSDDGSGIPEVPAADVTTKWQRYIWLRKGATSLTPYVWNDAASNHNDGSGNNIKKWYSLTSSIGTGEITADMIADNTITNDKIVSLDGTKLTTGISTVVLNIILAAVVASGVDITGTLSSLVIVNNAVTSAKILDEAVINSKLQNVNQLSSSTAATTGFDATTKMRPSGTAFAFPRTNTGKTAVEWVRRMITELPDPTSSADVGKVVRVASPYSSGYELSSSGMVLQKVIKAKATGVTCTTDFVLDDTLPQATTEGDEVIISDAFTPINAANLVRVQYSAFVQGDTAPTTIIMFLCKSGSANALQTVYMKIDDNDSANLMSIDYVGTAGAPGTYAVYVGVLATGATAYVNSVVSGHLFSTSAVSFLTIEEFQGTLA